MTQKTAVGRREFVITVVACGSVAGCIGTQREQPGVIDASDISIKSAENAELTAKSVKNDNDRGLGISTDDTVADGEVIAEVPTSVPDVAKSTVYILADVDELDDDAEVEIRFPMADSVFRRIYIGNEYKTEEHGVLATETGSGFGLEKAFSELPGSKGTQSKPSQELDRIEFVIRDGDFRGTIWQLGFIFEDWTIAVL